MVLDIILLYWLKTSNPHFTYHFPFLWNFILFLYLKCGKSKFLCSFPTKVVYPYHPPPHPSAAVNVTYSRVQISWPFQRNGVLAPLFCFPSVLFSPLRPHYPKLPFLPPLETWVVLLWPSKIEYLLSALTKPATSLAYDLHSRRPALPCLSGL